MTAVNSVTPVIYASADGGASGLEEDGTWSAESGIHVVLVVATSMEALVNISGTDLADGGRDIQQ